MRNSSGWVGYSVADLYPDMGDMVTTSQATTPDPEEIEMLSAQEPEKRVGTPIHSKTRSQVWGVLAALVILLLIFGTPRG